MEVFALRYFKVAASLLRSRLAYSSLTPLWDLRGDRKIHSTPSLKVRITTQLRLPLRGLFEGWQEHGLCRSFSARPRRADRLNLAYAKTLWLAMLGRLMRTIMSSARKLRFVWYHTGAMRQFCYWSESMHPKGEEMKSKFEG